ncbi:metallophosphoesterase [Mariniflexile litorale]|uniref:Metallophosphoesterase n=1 Tax=Mariniflexile litorale TaxID=3045158 RepID=A0AAU7EGV0_9FLAO|nr:metallophosphoesterase [Mariniflexile sp. KMM 9835]MDQ8210881.1 metallophosphoesterase [Mariniflexile sp. KMM 9835]
MVKLLGVLLLLFSLSSCKAKQEKDIEHVQIAFIADAHFADIYGEFQDHTYKGIKNPLTGEYANIRTMSSQLQSTRIFNENYFAFITALNDIAKRGIKLVALPGDFSDDGQPIHIRGLRRILNEYSIKYGMSFYVTTGNHDAVRPFSQEAKKTDFLGQDGKEQIITSFKITSVLNENALEPIITSDIKNWGYKEMMHEMSDFGFFPKINDLYWETPFSEYKYENYNFDEALKEADLDKRVYPIKNTSLLLPDASYLAEPVKNVWLLAIDANVYVPNENLSGLKDNPNDFSSASVGYNNVLLYKNHLINWVKKVAEEAKRNDKVLIAFSHYPMIDFNDAASADLKQFFGADKMQLHRVPDEAVAKAFANAGIKIHFGGHMHINDTGVRKIDTKHTLFNIQTPSLAAYKPAYKILNILSDFEFEVETVVLNSVENFNSLFPFYEQEYTHLEATKHVKIWNKDILKSVDYKDFTEWHLKELVRLRFLKKDFPTDFLDSFLKLSGKGLLEVNKDSLETNKQLMLNNLLISDFKTWTGFDMIYDFYRLRNADELAVKDIGDNRLKQYRIVCNELEKTNNKSFVLWAKIFQKTLKGAPSNHFKINIKTNSVKRID